MIQLGATVLNPNLTWPDRDNYSPVLQDAGRTLGGTLYVNTGQESAGRPITLVAIADQGWFDKAQKDAVVAMAQSEGAQYTLTIGAESFNVMFRHQDAPAAEFAPLIDRAVDNAGDYFTGTIKLMTV